MSTELTPPDPEQIIPPSPPSRSTLVALAVGVVVVLVVAILLLRGMIMPGAPRMPGEIAMPTLGAADAPLTIFEYANFGCERCARIQPAVRELLARYDGKVRLVFINYPRGPQTSSLAALAGICAAEQGKFWPFAELMFERQSSWLQDPNPMPLWMLYASQVGLDTNRILSCVNSSEANQTLQQQVMMAGGQMIQQTPTFLIGGSRVVNPSSLDDLEKAVEKELAALNRGPAR